MTSLSEDMYQKQLRADAQKHILDKRKAGKERLREQGENMIPFTGEQAVQFLDDWNPPLEQLAK